MMFKKICDQIKRNSEIVANDDFDEFEWKKKGQKITLNINNFKKLNNYLLNTVNACKDENSQIDQEFKDKVLGEETNITNYS